MPKHTKHANYCQIKWSFNNILEKKRSTFSLLQLSLVSWHVQGVISMERWDTAWAWNEHMLSDDPRNPGTQELVSTCIYSILESLESHLITVYTVVVWTKQSSMILNVVRYNHFGVLQLVVVPFGSRLVERMQCSERCPQALWALSAHNMARSATWSGGYSDGKMLKVFGAHFSSKLSFLTKWQSQNRQNRLCTGNPHAGVSDAIDARPCGVCFEDGLETEPALPAWERNKRHETTRLHATTPRNDDVSYMV